MAIFKIFRETALPGTLQPYSIYIVAPAAKPNYVEIYVSNSDGSAARRMLREEDIQTLINNSVSAANNIQIVADIAARNALTPTTSTYVYVRNATADATVAAGGATYLYDTTNTSWVKISEAESLDISLSWAALTGKPSSSAANIDDAVTKRHTHANMTELNKIGESGGQLTYDGQAVTTQWASTGW